MNPTRFAVLFLILFGPGDLLVADLFSYGDREPASEHHARFGGKECRILVYGPTGGSYVAGTYDDPNGELRISVDRFSYLELTGRARKVVVTLVDRKSNVNLVNLAVGDGGIEIHSVSGRSKVETGRSVGPVILKSVEASSISVQRETHVKGRDRIRDGGKLFVEDTTK